MNNLKKKLKILKNNVVVSGNDGKHEFDIEISFELSILKKSCFPLVKLNYIQEKSPTNTYLPCTV